MAPSPQKGGSFPADSRIFPQVPGLIPCCGPKVPSKINNSSKNVSQQSQINFQEMQEIRRNLADLEAAGRSGDAATTAEEEE